MTTYDGARAVVIGGSIGGLTATPLVRDLGFAEQKIRTDLVDMLR